MLNKAGLIPLNYEKHLDVSKYIEPLVDAKNVYMSHGIIAKKP
jgi:hypothetical protein